MIHALRERMPHAAAPVLLAGILLGLAHPPFHLLVPSFVALVPFIHWLQRLPRDDTGRREAGRGGFLLGLVYYTLVFYWLFTALVWYTWLAALAFLAPVLILSFLLGAVARGVHETRVRLGWPVWLTLPVFWTAAEWLRAHLGDVSFPWMQLGDTLTGFPWLIGAADLVGSRGLTLWLVLANGLMAEAIRRTLARRRGTEATSLATPALALAVVLALPAGYSVYRWTTLETRPAVRVGVIQPNVPEHIKLEGSAAIDSALASTARLLATRSDRWRRDVDLVLLPEVTLPELLEPGTGGRFGRAPELRAWAAGLAARLDADLLVGAYGYDWTGEGTLYNSAFFVDPEGRWGDRYDKIELVPVVERVPFVNPEWFAFMGPYFGGLGVGDVPRLHETDGREFGVLICYESIFSELTRAYRRRGADFLVNITNDAWFGRAEPWWSRSSALWQHPAHLVMRAVETRVGIARAANTGISEIVDPRGRTHRRTRLFEEAAFTGTVRTTRGLTFYVRHGDLAGWASALLALAAVGLTAFRGRGAFSGSARPAMTDARAGRHAPGSTDSATGPELSDS